MIGLDFIDIRQKFYCILNNENHPNFYTLFEYCIMLQKYKYIKKYC